MIKKHTRPTQKNPQGGILEIEGTIHVSNVMLVCPNCAQPTRVGRAREDGAASRVCKKCGKRDRQVARLRGRRMSARTRRVGNPALRTLRRTTNVAPRLKEKYRTEVVPKLKDELGLGNVNEVPRLEKIVVNMGVGRRDAGHASCWTPPSPTCASSPARSR